MINTPTPMINQEETPGETSATTSGELPLDDNDEFDNDEKLKIYLQIGGKMNLYDPKVYNDAFRLIGKQTTAHFWIRGASMEYGEVVQKLVEFYSLSYEDQRARNDAYRAFTSDQVKAINKENAMFLSKMSTMVSAVRASPRGEQIANDVGFNLLDIIAADSSGDEESDEEPELLDDDERLKIYLQIGGKMNQYNREVYNDAFELIGKQTAAHFGIRGASKEYGEVIQAIKTFYALSYEDQRAMNDAYRTSTSDQVKARHKENAMFLSKMSTMVSAVRASPRGEQIANDVGFNLLDIIAADSSGDEESDEEPLLDDA